MAGQGYPSLGYHAATLCVTNWVDYLQSVVTASTAMGTIGHGASRSSALVAAVFLGLAGGLTDGTVR